MPEKLSLVLFCPKEIFNTTITEPIRFFLQQEGEGKIMSKQLIEKLTFDKFRYLMLTILFLGSILISNIFGQEEENQSFRPSGGLIPKVITKFDSTKIRSKPDLDAKIEHYSRILRPLFVFNPSKKSKRLKKQGFYKVGFSTLKKDIIGWVHENDVVEWNHREGAIFTEQKGRKLARIYSNLDDLKASLSNRSAEKKAISQEPQGLDQLQKRCKLPLPILEQRMWMSDGGQVTAYKVAYLHAGTSNSGQQKLSQEEIAKQYGSADIVFVIDATISMRPYIEAVRDVVSNIARGLQVMQDTLTIRLGLVAFRDYDFGKPASVEYVVKRFVELTPDLAKFERELSRVQEAPYSNPGCPEAVFDGVFEAIAKTKWNSSGLKVIILIGDNSGYEPGHKHNPNKYSLDLLQDMANQKRIRFLCLKIEGMCNTDNDQEKHRKQLMTLADGKGPESMGQFMEIPLGSRHMIRYTYGLENFLLNEIRLTRDLLETAVDFYNRGGYTGDRPQNITDDDWAIIFHNLGSEVIDPGVADPPSFSTGWILKNVYGKYANVYPAVMMSQTDLIIYNFYMNLIFQHFNIDNEQVLEVMVKEFEKIAGEPFDKNETIKDYLSRKWDLPINNAGLLSISPEDAKGMNDAERLKLLDVLRKKMSYLSIFSTDPANFITVGNEGYRIGFIPLSDFP